MTTRRLSIKDKNDIDVGFENSANRSLSIRDMIERIQRLNQMDKDAEKNLLRNAILKGALLKSLKDQSEHGAWSYHLKTLGFHERYAQRLMSLVPWQERLMGERLKFFETKHKPLSVTEAFQLASKWSKEIKQATVKNPTVVGVDVSNDQQAMHGVWEKRQKNGGFTITWKLKVSDVATLLERFEDNADSLTKDILKILQK